MGNLYGFWLEVVHFLRTRHELEENILKGVLGFYFSVIRIVLVMIVSVFIIVAEFLMILFLFFNHIE